MKRTLSIALASAIGAALLGLPSAWAATTTLNASSVSASQANEVSTSYHYLTSEFYKKVDDQKVLDGARKGLLTTLNQHHINAKIPTFHAGSDDANVRAVDLELETAQRAAGKKVSAADLTYSAIGGMLNSVDDRYTVFLDPKDYAELNSGLDGVDFGGTGIVIQEDDVSKYISVSDIVPDGPGDKAGVQQDDLIIAIDGESTKGWTIDRASGHLRGKEGTKVTITLQRDGKNLPPITLTRAKIHQLSVFEKMLPGNIGYVALTVFGKDTSDELATALDRLQKKGAKAFIMDLRNNGGGYLQAAVGVSSKFIGSGPIVSVESRGSNITTLEASDTAITPVPLVVLVNQFTASASEITSGAIQDSGVGTIVGEKTFGKGVVQTIYPLPDGSAVKITTARYLTPHNRDINHLGIEPDIVVAEPRKARFGDPKNDPQLVRAMDFIGKQIAKQDQINGSSE
jgi:carboxyl-terminal processing protease